MEYAKYSETNKFEFILVCPNLWLKGLENILPKAKRLALNLILENEKKYPAFSVL